MILEKVSIMWVLFQEFSENSSREKDSRDRKEHGDRDRHRDRESSRSRSKRRTEKGFKIDRSSSQHVEHSEITVKTYSSKFTIYC